MSEGAEEPEWPWATAAVSGLILAVYLAESILDRPTSSYVLSGDAILRTGATSYASVVDGGEWWRLIGAAFTHVALWHVLLNGIALIQIGSLVEELWGPERFAIVYVVSAVASSLLTSLLSPEPSAGASGAIMGLLGFTIVAGWTHDAAMRRFLRALFGRQLVFWTAVTFLLGATLTRAGVPIDNYGHAGGAIAGGLLALVLRERGEPGPTVRAAATVAGLVTLLSLALVAAHGDETTNLELTYDETVAAIATDDTAAVASGLAILQHYPGAPGRLVGHDPAHARNLTAVAIVAGRPKDALEFAQRAVALDPMQGPLALAEARLAAGEEVEAARKTLEDFAEHAPIPKDPVDPILLGVPVHLDREGQSRMAIHLYDIAIRREPRNASLLNETAWILLTARDKAARDPERALDLARRAALMYSPSAPMIVDTLAEAEYQLGFLDLALEHEQKAIALGALPFGEPVVRELEERKAKIERALAARE
ncbi:MAG TPA: rhomboid family intramembrane serine protease [Planctomycetota bacterium]|nr:rhomboid family intramembrane serine protease [Planctomycetota bacterium]